MALGPRRSPRMISPPVSMFWLFDFCFVWRRKALVILTTSICSLARSMEKFGRCEDWVSRILTREEAGSEFDELMLSLEGDRMSESGEGREGEGTTVWMLERGDNGWREEEIEGGWIWKQKEQKMGLKKLALKLRQPQSAQDPSGRDKHLLRERGVTGTGSEGYWRFCSITPWKDLMFSRTYPISLSCCTMERSRGSRGEGSKRELEHFAEDTWRPTGCKTDDETSRRWESETCECSE